MPEKENKTRNMSLACDEEFQNELKAYSKKKGLSISSYIRLVMMKAMKLKIEEEPVVLGTNPNGTTTPVVLLVPKDIKGNPELVRTWLNERMDALCQKISQS